MFCMVVPGFIGASEMIGVTSFCRFWGLNTTDYHAFIHFFRASTWSLDKVTEYWNRFVLSQNETVNRAIWSSTPILKNRMHNLWENWRDFNHFPGFTLEADSWSDPFCAGNYQSWSYRIDVQWPASRSCYGPWTLLRQGPYRNYVWYAQKCHGCFSISILDKGFAAPFQKA